MESASLYEYNEDELLASIAASVYPNAKIRGVVWNVHYSGRQHLLPHADYLNLIQIISQLIKTIIEQSETSCISLFSSLTSNDLMIFEIECMNTESHNYISQSKQIELTFERMKYEYVGQLPTFTVAQKDKNTLRYVVSFRLRGNELYPHLKQNKKIMIAETDRGLLSVMADALSRDGYTVAVSEDPARILTTIDSFNPELILLSLNLGDQNGLEACAAIRQRYPKRKLLVLALLALTGSEEAGILEEAGFSGYILKPKSASDLKGFVLGLRERIRSYE